MELVKQRTPPWADLEAIAEIYLYCPPGYHVDHVIPLKGVTEEGWEVCGLHWEENLDYLPAAENVAKRNRCRQEDAKYYDGFLPPDAPDLPDEIG